MCVCVCVCDVLGTAGNTTTGGVDVAPLRACGNPPIALYKLPVEKPFSVFEKGKKWSLPCHSPGRSERKDDGQTLYQNQERYGAAREGRRGENPSSLSNQPKSISYKYNMCVLFAAAVCTSTMLAYALAMLLSRQTRICHQRRKA